MLLTSLLSVPHLHLVVHDTCLHFVDCVLLMSPILVHWGEGGNGNITLNTLYYSDIPCGGKLQWVNLSRLRLSNIITVNFHC